MTAHGCGARCTAASASRTCAEAVSRFGGHRVGGRVAPVGLRLLLALVRVAHRVLAEVFEVFGHALHEVGGLAHVGVEGEEGVGVEDHGDVGLIAGGAGGLELAEHLLGTLVVAVGDELAHLVVLGLELVGDDEQAEAVELALVLQEVLQHVVDEAALLHVVLAGGDFVVLDDLEQRLGVLCGLGDGELGVGLDGVAQRGVELVALLVGLLEGGGVVAGAILLVPKAANTYGLIFMQ